MDFISPVSVSITKNISKFLFVLSVLNRNSLFSNVFPETHRVMLIINTNGYTLSKNEMKSYSLHSYSSSSELISKFMEAVISNKNDSHDLCLFSRFHSHK